MTGGLILINTIQETEYFSTLCRVYIASGKMLCTCALRSEIVIHIVYTGFYKDDEISVDGIINLSKYRK